MIPVAFVWTSVLFAVIDRIRSKIEEAKEEESGGAAEERADLWNEGAEDAEDDIGRKKILVMYFYPV